MKISLIILTFFFLTTEASFAQWSTDSTTNTKVCQTSGDQNYPEIASDGAGGAIIVWEDGRSTSKRIYAQRLDSTGVAKWANNGIVISTAENSQYPKIISDGSGGAIIIWFDGRPGWPNSDVAVQRVSSNGDTLWKANGIVLTSYGNSWAYPSITSYDGGALVTWIGSNGEVYAQKIDTSGNIYWNANGVQAAPSGGLPQITDDNAGGAIITWFDYDDNTQYTHIFAQRINSTGTVMWLATGDTICHAPGYQHKPEIISDGTGGAIIAWLDGRADTANYVYAQKVSFNGGIIWTKNGIRISDIKGYYRARIASDGVGGAFLTWMGGGYVPDIYVQRISGGGALQWTYDLRLTYDTSPNGPRIISDGMGGAFVIWEGTVANYIRAQHFNSDGACSFVSGGKTIAAGESGKGFPTVTSDGLGRAIVTWEQKPNYDTDIYATRTIIPGAINDIFEVQINQPGEFYLAQNFPNPFNPATKIKYSVPQSSRVSIKIFNSLGEEIVTLLNDERQSGEYELNWNAVNIPSGVYFYRIQAGTFVETKKMMLIK